MTEAPPLFYPMGIFTAALIGFIACWVVYFLPAG